MRDRIEQVITKHKPSCGYLEIRTEERSSTAVVAKDGAIDSVGRSTDAGGCVRALYKGGWGFVTFNSLDRLDDMAAKAIEQARAVGSEKSQVAQAPVIDEYVEAAPRKDPRAIPLEAKVALVMGYDDIIMSHGKPVTNSRVRYFDTFRTVTFANSDGSHIVQEFIDLGLGAAAMATRDGEMQQAHVPRGSSNDYAMVEGLGEDVKAACRRAVDILNAPKVKGGIYPTIVDQQLGGVFIHEAFGHTAEADEMMDNPSLSEALQIGRQIAAKGFNAYDSGLDVGRRGALVYDDEGVKTEKTWLIRDGVLVGHLHSRESAAKMGARPTGNARAISYKHPPIVRMRNTVIEPGGCTFEELLDGIKEGVYAIGAYGGTGGEMFSFAAECGYMIRNQKVAEMVRDVKLNGNLFKTLLAIDAVAGDIEFEDGPGGCGKGGQFPLPVTDGAPHFRIQGATIGGE
jgi:TldD protein